MLHVMSKELLKAKTFKRVLVAKIRFSTIPTRGAIYIEISPIIKIFFNIRHNARSNV